MGSVGGAGRGGPRPGFQVMCVLVALVALPACARELTVLAVPERAITERRDLRNFGEGDREAVLRFIAVGHLNPQPSEPVLEPLEVVRSTYGPVLRALENPDLRRQDRFEQDPAVAKLVEPLNARVVDATEFRPGDRHSRPAYRVGRCWFVFYASTGAGDPPLEKGEAIFQRLSVFCRNPQDRDP